MSLSPPVEKEKLEVDVNRCCKIAACNNLLFYIAFNAFGGLHVFVTNMVKYIATTGGELHIDLAVEVREAIDAHGGLNNRALESMALVRSTAYEVMRVELPVPL